MAGFEDMAALCADPDMGAQAYTVLRDGDGGKWVEGVWVPEYERLPYFGVIVPPNDEQEQLVPEGDRSTAMMTFYSRQPFELASMGGEQERESDSIEWGGYLWNVQAISNYGAYGFCAAIATQYKEL